MAQFAPLGGEFKAKIIDLDGRALRAWRASITGAEVPPGMAETAQDNARPFGRLSRQGIDFELGLLVGCSVYRGKPTDKINLSNVQMIKAKETDRSIGLPCLKRRDRAVCRSQTRVDSTHVQQGQIVWRPARSG